MALVGDSGHHRRRRSPARRSGGHWPTRPDRAGFGDGQPLVIRGRPANDNAPPVLTAIRRTCGLLVGVLVLVAFVLVAFVLSIT